ncbi:carboxypeptidase-like regulatory domain-containing protein [Edaphobacter flagellatus]|uniref:carboxypeptidase-like regulatory domain-containing protein n=1 Tax=Edaphobacter flagellatus TaxID=1933044 RepID=UPI0021B4C174|nr:carboxypeptidase-like regulatory domain-containing protein [Edaphobacter flagellatus]
MMRKSFALPFRLIACGMILSAGLAASAEPSSPSPYRITGVVLNSITGNPIARCHLEISLTGRNQGPMRRASAGNGFDADEHGRFSIPVTSAGAWRLTASAPGYVTQAFNEHNNYSSAIVLSASAPTYDLQFRLPPQGRISGSVLDEAGESVRNANVQLMTEVPPTPDHRVASFVPRFFAQTDDRGFYEFSSLPPGSYRIAVNARPWYASSVRQRSGTTSSSLDPSLDVAYPLTWYPGSSDSALAETLTLKAGDDRRADFQLTPIPSLHLQIIAPPPSSDGRTISSFPIVERIDSNGANGFVQSSIGNNNGQFDISGLTPGTYRVRLQGPNQDPRSTVVQVTEGAAKVIDFSSATSSSMSNITVHFDRDDDDSRPTMVEFTDTTNGQKFFPMYGGGRPMPVDMRRGQPREITLQVPPGRYEVNITNRSDSYLASISAQGADVEGRILTLHQGDVTLTLHTVSGLATVKGIASLAGKPSVGAVVMLVPAALDDPGSFTTLERDQSNTDGSFDLNDVVPGQYILIAVDQGWDINFNDPATLRNYLVHGVPLVVRSGASIKQNVDAQAP